MAHMQPHLSIHQHIGKHVPQQHPMSHSTNVIMRSAASRDLLRRRNSVHHTQANQRWRRSQSCGVTPALGYTGKDEKRRGLSAKAG
jgi:hypothetical protein